MRPMNGTIVRLYRTKRATPWKQPGVDRKVRHPPTNRSNIVPSLRTGRNERRTSATAAANTTNEPAFDQSSMPGPGQHGFITQAAGR